jgi:glycosyltransferase involved in cell wall biosynthesis
MPAAIGDLELEAHDVVVSSTSGWAHGVRTRPGTFHVAYCHNPARWLYEADGYLGRGVKRMVAAPLCKRLRRWDQAAARRPDLYVVNSAAVQRKVRATYGIDAPVVHPPVDVGRFTPGPRGERLLIVSRLLPYKRVDLAVAAATRLGVGLDVVGEGPELANLQRIAGPTVTFHGRLPDDEVTHLMQTCAGFCLPGAEDFGITPVEANAAGKPVIAYAAGGALETTVEGITGTFIHEQTVEAMEAAMGRVLSDSSFDPWMAVQNAERFSSASFAEQLVAVIERGLERAPSRAPVTTPVPALLAA